MVILRKFLIIFSGFPDEFGFLAKIDPSGLLLFSFLSTFSCKVINLVLFLDRESKTITQLIFSGVSSIYEDYSTDQFFQFVP